jgi:DNA-binding MarR family transcriptional regulator
MSKAVSAATCLATTAASRGSINLVVRKLERERLVSRNVHESRGRVLRLELTRAGEDRLRGCKRAADGVERRILGLLDADAEPAVRRWLAAVAAALARG